MRDLCMNFSKASMKKNAQCPETASQDAGFPQMKYIEEFTREELPEGVKDKVLIAATIDRLTHKAHLKSLFFSRFDNFPYQSCQRTTRKRSHNEHPKVGKSLTALKQSWTNGTSRVHGRAGIMNTDKVYQDK
jgi:hypothetical protein